MAKRMDWSLIQVISQTDDIAVVWNSKADRDEVGLADVTTRFTVPYLDAK